MAAGRSRVMMLAYDVHTAVTAMLPARYAEEDDRR